MRQEVQEVVLVHGAGSGPWVFDGWSHEFSGVSLHTVDLHADVDVAQASMTDYCHRVVACMKDVMGGTALCGWSMGGLVALMAQQQVALACLVLLEPSPPGEVQGFDSSARVEPGAFDPEDAYGRFPAGIASRPESLLARGERKRGISVPKLRCPTLVVSGDEFYAERGEPLARFYSAEHLHFPGLSHWDLVLRPEVPRAIASFITVHGS